MKKSTELRKLRKVAKVFSAGVNVNPSQKNRDYNHKWSGNSVGGVVNKNIDGVTIPNYEYSYCSARIKGTSNFKNGYILYQIQNRHEHVNEDAFWAYIKWVIRDSPWAQFFISKSISHVKKTRTVIIDRDVLSIHKSECMIAIRMAWEDYYNSKKFLCVNLWYELSKKTDPNLAFIATIPTTYFYNKDESRVSFLTCDSGHTPIDCDFNSYNDRYDKWISRKIPSRVSKRYNVYKRICDIYLTLNRSQQKDSVNPFLVRDETYSRTYERSFFIERMSEQLNKLRADLEVEANA